MAHKSVITLLSIADTPIDQEWGLQFVKDLPDNNGMLFKFQSPRILSFWGKNTYLPLDIAFINEGVIVKTERIAPLSLRSVTSGNPCTLALEVPAGTLEKIGAEVGSTVEVDYNSKRVTFND